MTQKQRGAFRPEDYLDEDADIPVNNFQRIQRTKPSRGAEKGGSHDRGNPHRNAARQKRDQRYGD